MLFARSALFAAALSAPLWAQGMSLDMRGGGALPGTTTFELEGTPGDEYLLLIALSEQQTPLTNLGITLEIPPTFVDASYAIPGFNGLLDASGRASAGLSFPAQTIFEGIVFSLQAIGAAPGGTFSVSNLVRLTPQSVGTFRPSLEAPSLPIVGGGVASSANGELLFIGGTGPVAQRYASRTEEWSLAGASFSVGLFSQSTGLDDGRVLFTGGLDLTGQPTADAAVYDPATQQTQPLTMGTARAGHAASVLGDGRVLITGGFQLVDLLDPLASLGSALASTEIFDPVTNTFAAGPAMLEARALHTSTSLTNGRVMIAGGLTLLPIVNVPTVSPTAYVFNPASGSFGLPAIFNGPRFLHSAVGLSDGRVLLVGGLSLDLSTFITTGNITDIVIGTRDDCQLFSTGLFGLGSFATVDGMQQGRAGSAVAALPNGGALIAGGFTLSIDISTGMFQIGATETADLFSQSPNSITPTGSMAAARTFPIATPLPDGTVMVVGGGPLDAEIYQR